ncbi:MAG TPA: ExeM/NucH family extracellular endonuclease, partial [Nocardioides sp.]|nr:ExeM/NucH family extracellular endonuclease [Nocardioides sp.]
MLDLTHARAGRALAAVSGLAIAATALVGVAPATANTSGPGLVINEAYGGGGNSGALYKNDFIELRNTTDHTVSLGGLSLQYRSAGGTGAPGASNVIVLPGVDVPAGDTYLVSGAAGTTGGTQDLPTPDLTSGVNMSGTGGQVFLADKTAPLDPGTGPIADTDVLDFVGWGSTTTSYEGAAPAPTTTNATSVTRNASGTDTNANNTDFATSNPPTPSACGSACVATPPPPPVDATIAQIQGSSDTSPLAGRSVVTQGVVTAAYPTGGFFGYVLQTDGTGSGTDATPGASDAVYVFQPSGAVAVQVGDYVQVTGTVSEFNGLTELSVPAAQVSELGAPPLGGVTALSTAYPTTSADREAHESELIEPTDRFTVTDNYSTNQYAEIGLATGDHQLWQPTDLHNPNLDPAGVAAVQADNAARGVVLDDGSSWNYLTTYKNTVMPWLRPDNPVRIGSTATLHEPVILDYRNNVWKFQPTHQVTDDGAAVATFSDTRATNQQPQTVGGDLRLGTFNVLNYFNTTGADWVAAGHTCTFYNDRTGDPVTDNTCSDNGPRGAAQSLPGPSSGAPDLTDPEADLERQRAKEVRAINTMDADILSLEEIENSVALGEGDRDDALRSLVDALNADAGHTRWAYAPSPDAADLPPLAEQDVIRTAFIYNPDTVQLVGPSKVLADQSDPGEPFANAREPLAQEFKRKGALDSDGFLVVVNHFKSKGDSSPPATGDNANGIQGAFNGDRVRQARALVDFAQSTAQADGTKRIFLVGDFNSYTQEDPMQVLYQHGFVNQPSDDPRDTSYEFGGMAGSLDHVLANAPAATTISGRDVWQINAEESVGFEYSRYNYNAELLYQPNQFRASDHNPEVVGVDAPFSQQASTVTATATSATVQKKKGTSRIDVTVTGAQGVTPTGTVEVWVDGVQVGTATLAGGQASVVVGPFASAGTRHVEVRYLGDDVTKPGSAATTVTV